MLYSTRPLNGFSDYIMTGFPNDLQNGLSDSSGKLVDCLSIFSYDPNVSVSFIQKLPEAEQKLAVLDIKMAYTGLKVLDLKNEIIVRLTDHYQDMLENLKQSGQISTIHINYQDLIFTNPLLKDTRVFTTGEVARSESGFYRNHYFIEESLQTANDSLDLFMQERREDCAAVRLDQAGDALDPVMDRMMFFAKELPKEHFDQFRPYFATNEDTGEKGPSGAFSANVLLFEAKVMGSQLPEERRDYIQNNLKYFPLNQQQQLTDILDNPLGVYDKVQTTDNDMCHDRAIRLAGFIQKFRGTHSAIVKKHIPGLIPDKTHSVSDDPVAGSAEGYEAAGFLQKRFEESKAFKALLVTQKGGKKECPFHQKHLNYAT